MQAHLLIGRRIELHRAEETVTVHHAGLRRLLATVDPRNGVLGIAAIVVADSSEHLTTRNVVVRVMGVDGESVGEVSPGPWLVEPPNDQLIVSINLADRPPPGEYLVTCFDGEYLLAEARVSID